VRWTGALAPPQFFLMDCCLCSADFMPDSLPRNFFKALFVPQGRRDSRPAIHRRFKEAKQEHMWRVPEGRLNGRQRPQTSAVPPGLSKRLPVVPPTPGDKSPGYYQSPFQGSGWVNCPTRRLYCGAKETILYTKKFPPCFTSLKAHWYENLHKRMSGERRFSLLQFRALFVPRRSIEARKSIWRECQGVMHQRGVWKWERDSSGESAICSDVAHNYWDIFVIRGTIGFVHEDICTITELTPLGLCTISERNAQPLHIPIQ